MANSVRETIRRNPMRPAGFDLFNQPEFSTQSEVRMSQALHYASRRIDVTKRSTYLNIWVSSEEVEVGPSLVLQLPKRQFQETDLI